MHAAYVHPTLLLALCDHYNRSSIICSRSPLCGLIWGRRETHADADTGTVSLLSAFEYEISQNPNSNQLDEHLNLLNEIYGKNGYLELVGIYTIDLPNCTLDEKLHEYPELSRLLNHFTVSLNNMIHLHMKDLQNLDPSIPLRSLLNVVNLSTNTEIPFQIRTLKAESLVNAAYTAAPKLIAKNNITENETVDNNTTTLALSSLCASLFRQNFAKSIS